MQESAYNVRSSQFAVRSSQFAVRVIYSLIPRSKRGFIFFMLAVSIFVFAGLYYFANVPSFWFDEMYTVGSIRSELTFMDTFNIYAHEEVNSPLYFFIAFFWYRIVPHTERALLSLSILFVILASIITGLIGEKLNGIKTGIFAFLFMIGSRQIMMQASFEFRTYSLLILVSAVNLYFYLQRLNNESWKNILLYGVTMCLLPYTHYVSVFLCFAIFLADCVLILRKHAGVKIIASYFIGALLFSPWLIMFMLPSIGRFSTNFKASFGELIVMTKLLWGATQYYSMPFLTAASGIIYFIMNALKLYWSRIKFSIKMQFLSICLFVIIFIPVSIYIYCAFFTRSPFFLLRYLFFLMPFSMIINGVGADYIYNKLKSSFGNKIVVITALTFFLFILENIIYMRHIDFGYNQPYREVANIIYKSEQDYQGKSIILTTDAPIFFEGWKELYLTADNTRKCPEAILMPNKNISDSEILAKLQSGNYDRIYLSWLHSGIEHPDVMKWLHSNYDFGDRYRPRNNNLGDYRFQILERRK